MKEAKIGPASVAVGGIGVILGVYSFLFLSPAIRMYFVALGAYIAILAFGAPFYFLYQKKREIESNFPVFLRDLAQECEAGATLPDAIRSASEGDYGLLTEEIKKIVYQTSLGVSVEEALKRFSERWDIPAIQRSVTSIIEAEKAGGSLFKTLNSISKSVYALEDLKKERRSKSEGFLATSYVIFFILVGVLLILLKILNSFAATASLGQFSSGILNLGMNVENYVRIFQELIVIQGFFTGLAIGETTEGDIKAGIIHMGILSSVGFFLFTIIVNFLIL